MTDKEIFEDLGFNVLNTAEEAEQEYFDQFDDGRRLLLHPFSLSCEGIWDYDVYRWFTDNSTDKQN